MNDEVKPPREWWVSSTPCDEDMPKVFDAFSELTGKESWEAELVHVIEMSAYIELKAECERLEVWKKEMELLTAGVFAFEHPEMQLGDRKFETVLKFAKERDSLAAQLAESWRMYDDAARAAHVRIARLEKALELALYYIEGDATYEGVKLKIDNILAGE